MFIHDMETRKRIIKAKILFYAIILIIASIIAYVIPETFRRRISADRPARLSKIDASKNLPDNMNSQ